MDTSLHFDIGEKNLNFKLRERLQARPGIELKGKGHFNTVCVPVLCGVHLSLCGHIGSKK